MPPVRSERLSLATFTEAPNLDARFKAIVMLLTDATANNLLAQIQASPTAKKLPEMGGVLTDQWDPVFRNLTGRLLAVASVRTMTMALKCSSRLGASVNVASDR